MTAQPTAEVPSPIQLSEGGGSDNSANLKATTGVDHANDDIGSGQETVARSPRPGATFPPASSYRHYQQSPLPDNDGKDNGSNHLDQLTLNTRPASFSGPPPSSRYPLQDQQERQQQSPYAYTSGLHPAASTSRLPYATGGSNSPHTQNSSFTNGRSTDADGGRTSPSGNDAIGHRPPLAGTSDSAGPGHRERGRKSREPSYEEHSSGGGRSSPRRARSAERSDSPRLGQGSAIEGSSKLHSDREGGSRSQMTNSSSSSSKKSSQPCAKCSRPMTGQFVRALGTVFHLDCFRCQDCNKVVAAKFFPVDGPDGRQYPLCETDYFRRLSLICAKCGAALRGSYITALDMKFHVEHFTCSVCPTIFGPQDSYYEHSGKVYCHFHYSTRFAVKCTGCKTAILKQFVEINRNNVDEHWHPECYMIHKFWNIKLVPSAKRSGGSAAEGAEGTQSASPSVAPQTQANGTISLLVPSSDYQQQESAETAVTLRDKQKHVELQVYRIWTVLSTFEESSAACISEMLRHVSNGHHLEGVRMAEKFVLHVETLFASIDDLIGASRSVSGKDIPHVREARMLCKKVVNFFSLLSHTHESGARKMGITQDLLSLVTGLAHYLKMLIRIALTAALKLEREHSSKTALTHFLSRLDRLCKDPDSQKGASATASAMQGEGEKRIDQMSQGKQRYHGYKSLSRTPGTLISQGGEPISDLCEACRITVEEECIRFGTSLRWHVQCLCCSVCRRHASKDRQPSAQQIQSSSSSPNGDVAQPKSIYYKEFRMEETKQGLSPPMQNQGGNGASKPLTLRGGRIFCSECPSSSIQEGFEYVSRLEQYAFLLCVALNKLYRLLKARGVMPSSAEALEQSAAISQSDDNQSIHEAYRDSSDIKRMKAVNLDRKLSTTARVAQRSSVVESPSGRSVMVNEGAIPVPQIPSHMQQQIQQIQPPYTGGQKLDESIRTARYDQQPQYQTSAPVPSSQPSHQDYQQTSGPSPHNLQQSASSTSPPFRQLPPQHQQQHSNQQGPQSREGETTHAPRPNFNRSVTAIRVVDETSPIEHGAFRDPDILGSDNSPVRDEDGITLADLQQVMEAEQAREQQRPLPRHSQNRLLSELSHLEYFIVKHAAAITLASEVAPYREFAQLDELLDIIDAKKNNFWGKLFKGSGNKDKKEVKKKGVFGIPLDVLVEKHGADSMLGAGPGSLRVPMFIDDAITAMKQMDMSVEGVFRKNGNIRKLKDLADAIDRDVDSVNLQDDNPVQIAALLKKFLRDLPDPLLTFRLQHLWLATQRVDNDEDRKKILHLICCLMPKAHRDTMEVLFVFLKWVASFSHIDEETGSKMDLQNLATVICPNIIYSKGKDASRDESFLGIRAVGDLLAWQDLFFTVPAELVPILADQDLFANPNELSSKDILKKAELHLNRQRQRDRFSPTEQSHGFRGQVKQTHPHYHEAFSPPSFSQQNGSTHERPLSWQAPQQQFQSISSPTHQPFRGGFFASPQQQHQPLPPHQQQRPPPGRLQY